MLTQQNAAAVSHGVAVAPALTGEWRLTAEGFEKLLAQFDADRELAAGKYVALFTKLTRFFEWRGCLAADIYADATIDRVTRKIEQGAVITNFHGFLYGVARNIVMEALKEQEKKQNIVVAMGRTEVTQRNEAEPDYRLACIEACMLKLPRSGRELLLAYYEGGDSKLKRRRELARDCGVSLNALRIRVHRLRVMLEQHVAECINDYAVPEMDLGEPVCLKLRATSPARPRRKVGSMHGKISAPRPQYNACSPQVSINAC